jgi:hypothetical protein
MNTKVFHRLRLPLLAAALTVLLAAGTSAAADPSPDGREYWGGRSAAGTLYCYIHRDGRHWAMTMSSPDKTISIDGVEVARCGAFIELDFHGFHDRVYNDKLLTLPKSGRWIEIAKGKWGELPLGHPISAPSMIPRKLESAPGDPIPLPKAPYPVLEQPQLVPPTGNPILVPGPAPAPGLPPAGSPSGDRVYWNGQDHAGARFSFACAGRFWNVVITSERETTFMGAEVVRRCDDFIQLEAYHSHYRLYKDKLLTLSKSGSWTEVARGKWGVMPPGAAAPMMVPAPQPALGDPVKD